MLYLIRHADAVDLDNDALRPLSSKGHDQVRRLGKFLHANSAIQPDAIWHSRLLRAKETAELLARYAGLSAPLTQVSALEPEADPETIARKLRHADRSVAIVGHNPHLELLASLLVQGSAHPPGFVMKKASVLALQPDGERWLVRWHVSAELLP